MVKRKSNLGRNTRAAKFYKLQKKRRLEEANRQAFLKVVDHAGCLDSQMATETSGQTREKIQKPADGQKIPKTDEMIDVKNAPRIKNLRTIVYQRQSFNSRNICDTKNVSEHDLATINCSHGLVTREQLNNQSRFCKPLKSKEELDRARKDLLGKNMNPQIKMINRRVTNATKTPCDINIPQAYVSNELNTKVLQVTSPSNSTRPKIPNDKLETWKTKNLNTINSCKQTKSQVSSLESTCGKTEKGTMSFQTKKNLFGNSSETYRKEPQIYRDFQNISIRGTEFQNLPPSTSEKMFMNDKNHYNQSEQEMNNVKKSFFNEKSVPTDSKKMELARNKIGGIMHPNKSNDPGDGDLNANLLRTREKQEKPQKSVTYLTKDNEYFGRVHKIHLQNNIRENELTKMQNKNSMSTSQPPTVHIISNIKPQYASNCVQSRNTREVKLKDKTSLNLQKSRILYTAESNEKCNKNHSGPLFYHLSNTDKIIAIPNNKFQPPVLYGQSGTTRRNGDVTGRCKLIVPKQMIVHSGKRADGTQAGHVLRSAVFSEDVRKFQNSLKVSNFIPFSPYQQQNFQNQSSCAESEGHSKAYQNLSKVPSFDPFGPHLQQNYPVKSNSGRYQIGVQKHQKTLEVSNFGLIRSSPKQRHEVRPNIAYTENNLKTSFLNIRDNKPNTSNQYKSEVTDTVKRKKLSHNPENNQNNNPKSNASDQCTSGSTSTVKRQEFSTSSQNSQYGNYKQNAPSQYSFNISDTIKSHKRIVNWVNNQNNKSNASEQHNPDGTSMIKSLMLSAALQNAQYDNNNPCVSGQHDSEAACMINGQKLPGTPQNNHQKQEENTDNHKIKAARETFTKISELLINISEMLSTEFVCPTELKLSLPAWKAELERCMVSAEKIKVAISQQEKEKETTCFG